MIVGGQTEACASTVIDYHAPFEQSLTAFLLISGVKSHQKQEHKLPLAPKCPHATISLQILGTFCNMLLFFFLIKVPLGSIPELPAHSCLEIKASEGKDTISSNYWLDPTRNGTTVLVYCNMNLEGYT